MSRRILVTGAQGFLGRYVVADWLAADGEASVTGLGRSPRDDHGFTHEVGWCGRRWPAPLPEELANALTSDRYQYVSADLGDTAALTALIGQLRPEVVVHLAGSLRDEPPEQLVRANVGGLVSLLDAVVGSGIPAPRLVLCSSGSVYGSVPGRALPLHEDMPCRPLDPYSVSKRAAEDMGRILVAQSGLHATWARVFNPVGPGQDERHLCGWLGQQVASIAAGHQRPVVSVGPLHTTRDYIDVRDTATALRTIAEVGSAGATYNVATGVETTGEQVLECLLDRSGLRGQVEVVRRPGRPSDMERHFADVSRLSDLGWTPSWRLDESLEEVVGYYLDTVQRASAPASGGTTGARPAPAPVVLRTSSSHRCTVQLRAGLLDDLPDALTRRFPGARLVVLTDSVVQDLYGRALVDGLDAAGADVGLVTVPSGEASKSATSLLEVIAQLHELRTDRRSVLVCVGGGMVTDLGGFAAATYLRGIAYVNVPTTLLAQHDSAIGGKVGVNMPWAKNFVGAFHHPIEVHADPRVLRTLDDRNLRCGIAESVKVALCGAPGLFEMIEDSRAALTARDPEVLEDLVRRSAEHKVALLSPDPYEVDLRRALNLGHTFGHAVETEYGYEGVLHGEAVAVGLAVAAVVGVHLGECAPKDAERILDVVLSYEMVPALDLDRLRAAASRLDEVRLVRAGHLNYVVPTSTDAVRVLEELPPGAVDDALDELAAHPRFGRVVRS